MELHAYTRTISDLFSVKRKYVVPRFQREYSWTKEQVYELWEDIISNISINDDSTIKNEEYFIGSLVLVGDDKSSHHQIVDGQQRLTTITILLSVLCDRFLEIKKKNIAESVYENFIAGKDDDGEYYFKLENETPKPFFQTRIQHINKKSELVPDNREEKVLLSSYEDLYSFTSKDNLSKHFTSIITYENQLKGIRDQVVKYLKVIFITVSEEDEAYTIFETLNARGMNLSFVDLIKNTLFKNLKNTHPDDEAKTKWKNIRLIISSRTDVGSIETFVRHWWLARYSYVSAGKIYQSFKKQWKNGEIDAAEFINQLDKDAELYIKISSPVKEDFPQQEDNQIINSLMALKIFSVTQQRPFLLSLFNAKKNKLIKQKKIIEILIFLEKFHFIFNAVCSMRASGIDGTYSKAARDLNNAKDTKKAVKVVDDLIIKLGNRLPEKELFIKNFSTLKFVKGYTKDKKLIQYIFNSLEKFSISNQEFEPANITLEHVMSQSTRRYQYIGEIGNLLPLSAKLNRKAGDKDYNEKLKIYSESQYILTQSFAKNAPAKWGKKAIIERTKKLAEYCYDNLCNANIKC